MPHVTDVTYDLHHVDSPREPLANVLHDNKDDNEGAAHDELPPMEVRPPGVSQQIPQLLLDWIMPRERHCDSLAGLGGRNDVLAVPKDVLDLQSTSALQSVLYSELSVL